MLMNTETVDIVRSSTMQEQSFGIGNLSVILSILRSKLYSNPVRSMIQEILSNARDAHREAGNADKPIVIQFPCEIDPYFYIKDFGLGITPDRMSNVFLQYGASTKRGDNVQTGGFGIGAKSPFAYSDSFSIETITNELGYNMLRSYTAYIDETQIGKIALMNEERTNDPTGTKITVPVKEQDYTYFYQMAQDICRWWKVTPISNISINRIEIQKETDDYIIMDNIGKNIVLIDEIPYELSKSSITSHPKYTTIMNQCDMLQASLKLHFNNYSNCVLKFKTGELSISANRENIDYTDENMEVFAYKTKIVIEDIIKTITDDLASSETYKDAVSYIYRLNQIYREMFKELTGQITWKGLPIYETLRDGNLVRYYSYLGEIERDTKDVVHSFSGNHLLFYDDTTDFSIAPRIRTILLDDENENVRINVIRPEYCWDVEHTVKDTISGNDIITKTTSYAYKVPKHIKNYEVSPRFLAFYEKAINVLLAAGMKMLSTVGCTKKKRESTKLCGYYLNDKYETGEMPDKNAKFIFASSNNTKLFLDETHGKQINKISDYYDACPELKSQKIYILTNTELKRYKNKISLKNYLLRYFRKKSNDPVYVEKLDLACRRSVIENKYPRLLYDGINIPEVVSIRDRIFSTDTSDMNKDIKVLKALGFYFIEEYRYKSEIELELEELVKKYTILDYYLKSTRWFATEDIRLFEIIYYKEKAYAEKV